MNDPDAVDLAPRGGSTAVTRDCGGEVWSS